MARSNQDALAASQPIILPSDWAAGRGALHRRLAAALVDLMARGDLPAGAVLPTERELADAAGVSRATVASAYGLLKADGRVESRQGRGTWVRGEPVGTRPAGGGIAPVLVHPDDVIDLSLAASSPGPDLRVALADAVRAAADEPIGIGYQPAGHPELRSLIGAGRSERVVVTTGAQQAISLVVDELVSPGDAVVVEEVTYVGALDAARRAGARLIAVPTGFDGVDVEALRAVVERHRPALVYLNPTHQSPTGGVLADSARHEVVRLALATGTPIVDDRTLAELAFDDERRPRPLASFDTAAPIITVSSLSKTIWPGLRVGWVEAAPELVDRLVRRRMVDDLGGSAVSAAVAMRLWGDRAEWAARRAADLAAGHRHLVARLATDLADWSPEPSRGGTGLWVRLPSGDASSFASTAADHGVHVVAGPAVSPHGGGHRHLRLAITAAPTLLDAAVDRLVVAWEAYDGPPGRRPSVLV
jgi:DNA-binding transcriptional MocR family regulator